MKYSNEIDFKKVFEATNFLSVNGYDSEEYELIIIEHEYYYNIDINNLLYYMLLKYFAKNDINQVFVKSLHFTLNTAKKKAILQLEMPVKDKNILFTISGKQLLEAIETIKK